MGLSKLGDVLYARRGLVHAGDVGRQAGHVGDGAHLDGRLGAVLEGVVHLGIEVGLGGLFVREAVARQGLLGPALAELGQVARPLPRRDHLEACADRPVVQLVDVAGLVAVDEAVDDARLVGHPLQQVAHQHVGLYRDVDDVPVVHDRLVDVARARIGVARRLHHYVDLRVDGDARISGHDDVLRVHRVIRLTDL